MRLIGAKSFYGDDLLVLRDGVDRQRAGAGRDAVEMNRASAALGDPAAILRAGQADMLTNDPKQRSVIFNVDLHHSSVDVKFRHLALPV
jgi:hypothetical protein